MPTTEWVLPAFEAGVKAFSASCPAARGYTVEFRNKGPDIASIEGWVDCGGFALLFEYTAHSLLSEVNSTLECKLTADKDSPDVPRYTLMDVFNALELDDFRCVFITSISGETAMAAAFRWLGEIIGDHLPAITAMLLDEGQRRRLEACFIEDMIYFFPGFLSGANAFDGAFHFPLYYDWLRVRFGFAQGAYMRWLAGSPKKLARAKKTLLYERRLLAWLNTPGEKRAPLPPTLCAQAKVARGASGRFLLALYASWILLAALCLPFWLGLYYLLRAVAARGQLLLIGPEPWTAVLPALFTAVVLSFFTRRLATRLLFRRRAAEMLESDAIADSHGVQRFMKGFLYAVFLGGVCFLFLHVNNHIAFGETGFTDSRGAFSLRGEYHAYADIGRVYYRPDRVNGFGETIPFGSYVLALRDGAEIDLYEYCETGFAAENLLPLLEGKGVPVGATPAWPRDPGS
jgi:hypothetical protein